MSKNNNEGSTALIEIDYYFKKIKETLANINLNNKKAVMNTASNARQRIKRMIKTDIKFKGQ